MEGRTRLIKSLFFVLLGLVVLYLGLIFLIFLVFLYSTFISHGDEELEKPIYEYRYTRFDFRNNLTSTGIVTIFKKLNDGETLKYKDEDGSKVLISNFEHEIEEEYKKYECFGECLCESDFPKEEPELMEENVREIVHCVSLSLARQLGQMYIEVRCEFVYEHHCEYHQILGRVVECSRIHEGDEEEPLEREYEEEENLNLEEQPHRQFIPLSYFCHGGCSPRSFDSLIETQKAKEFGCESIKQEGMVNFESSSDSSSTSPSISFVNNHFKSQYLSQFCGSISSSRDGGSSSLCKANEEESHCHFFS